MDVNALRRLGVRRQRHGVDQQVLVEHHAAVVDYDLIWILLVLVHHK